MKGQLDPQHNVQDSNGGKSDTRQGDSCDKNRQLTYNNERATMILNTTYKTAMEGNLIPDRETLVTRIGNMIKSPNSNWSKKKPEWELPRTYFDA